MLVITYYAVNSVLVATIIALNLNRPVVSQYRASFVEFAIGVTIAETVIGIIGALLWGIAPWSAALVGFIVFIVYLSYGLSASLARRMVELQRRTAELEVLNQLNSALTAAIDLGQLWELLAEQVDKVIDAKSFFVALTEEPSGRIEIAYGLDQGTPLARQVIPPGTGISGWVVSHASPLLVRDFEAEQANLPVAVSLGSGDQPASILAVPLVLDGRVLGLLSAQSYKADAYSEDDVTPAVGHRWPGRYRNQLRQAQADAAESQALRHLNQLEDPVHIHGLARTADTADSDCRVLGIARWAAGLTTKRPGRWLRRSTPRLVRWSRWSKTFLIFRESNRAGCGLASNPFRCPALARSTARDFSTASALHSDFGRDRR